MKLIWQGFFKKMQVVHDSPIQYFLGDANTNICFNTLIGQEIELKWTNKIFCQGCGMVLKKSFQQGYCFPCTRKLACCDLCVLKPDLCHYSKGTCREPAWGEAHCMVDHIVYLANSGGIKVGLSRHSQLPTRFIDQGAEQACVIYRVANRRLAGLIESVIAGKISDRTDWRKMLRFSSDYIDLWEYWKELSKELSLNLDSLFENYGHQIEKCAEPNLYSLSYPISVYPEKIKSLSLDKMQVIRARLNGIKGQYLLLDLGQFNVRKHTGYEVEVSIV
jgi:hypothetical protein